MPTILAILAFLVLSSSCSQREDFRYGHGLPTGELPPGDEYGRLTPNEKYQPIKTAGQRKSPMTLVPGG